MKFFCSWPFHCRTFVLTGVTEALRSITGKLNIWCILSWVFLTLKFPVRILSKFHWFFGVGMFSKLRTPNLVPLVPPSRKPDIWCILSWVILTFLLEYSQNVLKTQNSKSGVDGPVVAATGLTWEVLNNKCCMAFQSHESQVNFPQKSSQLKLSSSKNIKFSPFDAPFCSWPFNCRSLKGKTFWGE